MVNNVSHIGYCPEYKDGQTKYIDFNYLYPSKEDAVHADSTYVDAVAVRIITAEAYQQIINTLIAIRDSGVGTTAADFYPTIKETLKTLGEDL